MGRTSLRRSGIDGFPRRYLAALRTHVSARAEPPPGPAGRLGLRAGALGIGILELARIHDAALSALVPPGNGPRGGRSLAVRAASFFAEAIAPVEATHLPAVEARAECRRLAAALEASEARHRALLERSRAMEERLRSLTRRLLASHEEERRRISRELHDALGQTLTGIHVQLATLRSDAAADARGLRGSIARTQRLVQRSMRTVHRFARDLRPTLLDDLGLVPALQSFAREFGRRNGIRLRFSAPEECARLDGDRGTALFRVAQEALVNVGRHARARNVRVILRRLPGAIRMEVRDDGRSFDVERMNRSRANRHLGLLCMRERVEMVGGTFRVESSPGAGTTVRAEVPLEEEPRA